MSEAPAEAVTPSQPQLKAEQPPLADTVDLTQAERWAETVLGGRETEWRCLFPGRPPRVAYGDFVAVREQLAEWNESGYQIYAVIDHVPSARLRELGERSAHVRKLDVTEVRCLFVDIDGGGDLAALRSAPLPPTAIVRSSEPGKLHAYWRVLDAPPKLFRAAQEALIGRYSGDPAVSHLGRVMRVPGFLHRKEGRDPVRSELLEIDPTRHYSWAEFAEKFEVDISNRDALVGAKLREAVATSVPVEFAPEAVDLLLDAARNPDLSKLTSRHDCLLAFINLGARAGRAEETAERLAAADDIRTAWVKDGNVRSNSEWFSEIDRALEALATNPERRYGVPKLRENGFDIPDLPRLTPPTRARHWSLRELLDQPFPKWHVRGLLMEDALAMIYGEPGAGKSFLVLDLALSMAFGHETWGGRRAAPGEVVYVAGEGQHGLGARVQAWCTNRDEWPADDYCPFEAVTSSGVLSIERADQALARIGEAVARMREHDVTPRLIIVDTLSRHLEGDENSSEDVRKLLAAADHLRATHGATVVLVHHSGKDPSRGARGSSALKGDLDTMLRVEKDSGYVVLKGDKQKDAPGLGGGIGFKKLTIALGDDEDGEAVTSLALEYVLIPPIVFDESATSEVLAGLDEKHLGLLRLISKYGRDGTDRSGVDSDELWRLAQEAGVYDNRDGFRTALRDLSEGRKDRPGKNIIAKTAGGGWTFVDWSIASELRGSNDDRS